MKKINATPAIPLLELSHQDRWLGRYMELDIGDHVSNVDTATKDLAADLFWLYYKARPEFVQKVPKQRKLNRKLLEWALETGAFTQGRASTVANLVTSAISASLFHTQLSQDSIWKELLEKQRQLEEERERLRQMFEQLAKQEKQKGEQDAPDSQSDLGDAESESKSDKPSKGASGKSGKGSQGTQAADESDDSESDGQSDLSDNETQDDPEPSEDEVGDEPESNESESDQDDSPADDEVDGESESESDGEDDNESDLGDDETEDDDNEPGEDDEDESESELDEGNLADDPSASLAERIERAKQRAAKLERELSAELNDLGDDSFAQATIAQAAKQAGDKAAATAQEMSGWGFGAGSNVRCDPNAAHQFMQVHADKLKQIGRLAGRLRGIAVNARRSRVGFGVIPTDVHNSQDPAHMFPTERMWLSQQAPRAMRLTKTADFLNGGLLSWKLTGNAKEQGPFVAAIDKSGSMFGEREIVAKAVALGVAQAAKMEGRSYQLFTFGARDPMVFVESKDDWKKHLEWAEDFSGGGTNFDEALTELMRRIDLMTRTGSKGLDALFISDGEAMVSDEVVEQWKKYAEHDGARLLYVEIGRGGYRSGKYSWRHGQAMWDLADHKIQFDEIVAADGDKLAELLAGWVR